MKPFREWKNAELQSSEIHEAYVFFIVVRRVHLDKQRKKQQTCNRKPLA